MIVQQCEGYESVTINRPLSREDWERSVTAFERAVMDRNPKMKRVPTRDEFGNYRTRWTLD